MLLWKIHSNLVLFCLHFSLLLPQLRQLMPKKSKKTHPKMLCVTCISANCAWTFALVSLVTDLPELPRWVFPQKSHIFGVWSARCFASRTHITIVNMTSNKAPNLNAPRWHFTGPPGLVCAIHFNPWFSVRFAGVGTIDRPTARLLEGTIHRAFVRYSA